MSLRTFLAFLLTACLAACGGEQATDKPGQTRLLSMASAVAPQVFPGVRADYTITETASGYTVKHIDSGASTDVPRNARLRFADTTLGLDIDGVAGSAYRLYRAAFDRRPDAAGLGYWINVMDGGTSLTTVAGGFIASDEFKALYGANPSNAELVNKLYEHVLHRAGDPAGIAYWTGVLDRRVATRAEVLAAFGESAEMKEMLADAIKGGITYLEAAVVYVPAANPGPERIVDWKRSVTLDGSASTVAAGRKINYYWSLGNKPFASKAGLTDTATAHPSFVPDVEGKYEIKLVVSDGISFSREAKVQYTAVWRPTENTIPPHGTAVYVESEPGEWIGRGKTYLFTRANATIQAGASGPYFSIAIEGSPPGAASYWMGGFSVPARYGRLRPGFYGELTITDDPSKGAMQWTGGPYGCMSGGWLVIDHVAYDGDKLMSIDLRFEQRCDGVPEALRGRVRWFAYE